MSSEYVRPLRPLKPDQITTHWMDGPDGSPGCWSQHTRCVDVYVARLRAERDAMCSRLTALEIACVTEDSYGFSCNLCCGSGIDRDAIDHDSDCVLASDVTPLPGEGSTMPSQQPVASILGPETATATQHTQGESGGAL